MVLATAVLREKDPKTLPALDSTPQAVSTLQRLSGEGALPALRIFCAETPVVTHSRVCPV